MITLTVPGDGYDATIVFPAELAAEPMTKPVTVSLPESKTKSKLTMETSAPPWESNVTGTVIPVSPGLPDMLPAVSTANGPCAEAVGARAANTQTIAAKINALCLVLVKSKAPHSCRLACPSSGHLA